MLRVSLITGAVLALLGASLAAGQITSYIDERGRRVYVNADPKPKPEAAKSEPATPTPGKRSVLVRRDPKTGKLVSVPALPRADGGASVPPAAAPGAPQTAQPGSAIQAASPAGSVRPNSERQAETPVPTATSLDGMIEEAAQKHAVDPNLVRAIIKVESNFNQYAVSRKGARGLMQLMPQTASVLGVRDPYNPAENITGGVRYLRQMLDTFAGNFRLSLAAYNAGPGAVERHGGVPPYAETRQYVNRITALYNAGSVATPFSAAHPSPQYGNRWGIMKYRDARGVVHFSNTEGN